MDPATYFADNLAALHQHHPAIGRMIAALGDAPAVQLRRTAAAEWTIDTYTDADTATPYYPTDAPGSYSRSLVDNLRLTNPRILILLGLGLGYHLQQYAQSPDLRNRLLLVLEAVPQVFRAALHVADFSELFASKQIHWIIGADVAMVRDFFAKLLCTWPWLAFANAIEYFPLPPAQRLSSKYFQQVQEILPQEIGHQYNRHVADPYDSFIGIEHTLDNLPILAALPLIDQAAGCCREVPGILVASGPSLTHALPAMQAVAGRAVVAACPSALPVLLREGIAPHIWLNIERGESLPAFFAGLPAHPPHIFVAPPLVHPELWASHGGTNVAIRGASLLTNWLQLPGAAQDLGHSSAHTAFRILAQLGCDPIFLVGQDLAYHASASHAPGTWQDSGRAITEMTKDGRRYTVPGNNGGTVDTNIFWWTFLKTYQEQLIPEHPGRIYNVIPADYGAAISGTTRIDPAQLIDHCAAVPGNVLERLQERLHPPAPVAVAERSAAWRTGMQHTVDLLMTTHQECMRFALHCKRVLFHSDIGLQQWEKTQPVWAEWVAAAEAFQMRFLQRLHSGNRDDPYVTFFHPLMQGLQMRYMIEYYSKCTDLTGDFSEIQRKLEIMHHMAKDEAHWAMQCYQRLTHTLQALEGKS